MYQKFLLKILDINQAEVLMSCLKQLIEKQNSENQYLQDTNSSLKKENKNLVEKNIKLLKLNKK